ncbi:MAG: ABC transporter substrate-binding protein [Acidobacteria bacterium]|nr:MAG: ABC transporter substrate-binding protein [Acidobacteriota bacterium]
MKLLAALRFRIATLFQRSQINAEMEEELRSHIQHRADDLALSGVDRGEAERLACIEFGGRERIREECHKALGGNFLDTLLQDVRFSFRMLRKSPSFTAAAVVTLALAIGANAVVFGVLDALILRPLNVPQVENLYGTQYGLDPGFQSYPNYLDLRDRNRSFDGLAAFNFVFVGLDTGKDPSTAMGFAATGNYFDVLRIHPYLGRFFHGSDEHGPNSAPFLVLSYAYWHSRFQDDRGAVGRVVQVSKHPFTIIGVAPPEFRGSLLFISPDFFMPIINQDQVNGENLLNARGTTHGVFEAIGHLKPGVTPEQAVADLNAVGAYLEKTYPKEFGQKSYTLGHAGLTSFDSAVREFVTGLMLLAGLILLAACANLGGLFAARAADRSREVALRLALGSSRKRILRQLLTEAVLISLLGGAAGLLGSVVLLRRLSTWQPFPGAPIHLPVRPDAKIYVVALVLALVSGLLFGIVPVRQVLRANPYEIVKAGLSARVGRRTTLRDVLLVVQIAICAVLVTSSMVAVRGLLRSLHGNFGFEPRNAMLAGANLAMAGYSAATVPAMQERMIHAMETIPGVEGVGLVNDYPPLIYGAGSRVNVFKEETRDLRPSNAAAMPYRYDVSPEYFYAAGTTLLAGRDFSWDDDKNAPPVAVVNREFAGKIFGSVSDTVGRYYKMQDGTRVQVVGVVEDGKYLSLTENQEPAIFLPFLRLPSSQAYLVVRSSRDPQQLAVAMRSKLRELDEGLPVDTSTWYSRLDVVLFPSLVATASLGVLGMMGAILSITGTFGMAAYSVTKRLRELGIRVALGAQRREVLQAALGRALKLLAFGSAAGLLLGMLASRVLAFIVYSATPRDPLVLAGVVLAMSLLGLLATWIPARRALSVDPLIMLREE